MGKYKDDKGTELDGDAATWQSLKAGGVNGCKIVWETVNTATTPSKNTVIYDPVYDKVNGVLTITPKGTTAGNALVAVTSKDGSGGDYGEILWSYHIWVPSTPVGTVTQNNISLMDRNLGALTAASKVTNTDDVVGLLYQWGRKDPLLGFVGFTSNSMNGVSHSPYTTTGITESVKNPDRNICSSDLWCNQKLCKLWGYSFADNPYDAPEDYTKTIYDPCPSGYRVASTMKYMGFLNLTFRSGSYTTAVSISSDEKARNVGDFVFPYGQYFITPNGSSSNSCDGANSNIWTACGRAKSLTDTRTTAWFVASDSAKFGLTKTGDGSYRAYAYNVRCVKE